MKTNDLKAALSAFLEQNPDLPEGPNPTPADETPAPGVVTLHVSISKKGRNGKTATIIDGLNALASEQVETLAKELKKHLGVGGSCRSNEILVQGNMIEGVKKFLTAKGYRVK